VSPTIALSSVDLAAVADAALFDGLTAEQLEVIRPLLRCKTLPAGTNVIAAELPGDALFIILSGTVKVQVEQSDGSEVILAILGRGQSVGEMSVTDKLDRSASVITLDESTLAWMDRVSFTACQRSMPRLTENLALILSNRLRIANAQIQALATQDVHGRVARQLLSLAEVYGTNASTNGIQIPMRLTQGDLANLVGASRVRVNQVLVLFKDAGYISVDGSYRITVNNKAALAARCR
jgi:CRP/FNR family cyclic AMP-dependent transcriptional regulator